MNIWLAMLIVWLVAFIYVFLRSFFEKDRKFGQYKVDVALIVALGFTTIVPISFVVRFVTNPKKAFRELILDKYE